MDINRMFCPSTNEIIFAPGYEEINDDADAFIAYWHGEVMEEPSITDEKLKADWNEFFEKWNEAGDDDLDIWDAVEKFLTNYENPDWIVYECTFYGMACGPTSTNVYYVVKAGTVIEDDPDYDEEAEEKNPLEGMTEQEIEDEIIGRQLGALHRGIAKEK